MPIGPHVVPEAMLEGMPANATTPVAASYVLLAPLGNPVSIGAVARAAGSVTVTWTPIAVLGPIFANSSVPKTGSPALTLDGKFNFALKSATATPPITTVTLLLLRLLSAMVMTTALTEELPEGGWR